MQRKSFFIAVILVAVLWLGLAIDNANQALAKDVVQPITAQFLPKQAPLVLSFLVNPDRLSQLAQQGASNRDRQTFEQELKNLKQLLQQTWSINYDRDLKPWLGQEATVAVTSTDLDHNLDNGLQPGYLLALATNPKTAPTKYLNGFWQKQAIAGADLKFEQYQGVSLVAATNYDKGTVVAGTTIGKFVLFANDLKVLRNAINNLQAPGLALINDVNYQQSLVQLAGDQVAVGYINLPKMQLDKNNVITQAANLINFPPRSQLTLGWSLENFGVKTTTVWAFDHTDAGLAASKLMASGIETTKNTSMSYIPAGSSIITGRNLTASLDTITQNLATSQLSTRLTSLIAQVADHLSLTNGLASLEQLQGDYAIALLPQISPERPHWLFVDQNTDPTLTTFLAQLDQTASAQFTVAPIMINNHPLKVWTKLTSANGMVTGDIALAHAEIGDRLFVANSVEAIASALHKPESMIESDRAFKAINRSIPSQNYIYLHNPVNLPLSWLPSELSQIINNSWLHHIESLAIVPTGARVTDQTTFVLGEIIANLQ